MTESTRVTLTSEEGPFEVHGEDLGELDWAGAEAACAALADDGGGWRLPTIVELKFMYRTSEFCRNENDVGYGTGYHWAGNQAPLNPVDDGAAALFFAPYERDGMPGYCVGGLSHQSRGRPTRHQPIAMEAKAP